MKVSISGVRLFKSCRRAWELRYLEGLIPVVPAESLQTGSSYHSKIEELYNKGCISELDLTKESAMAKAYEKYIYPKFRVRSVEEWFEMPITSTDTLISRLDGVAEDGYLVEHKTTSGEIGEDYEYGLMWDEQVLAYMLATGARKIHYTVIRKPTIRIKRGESEADFFQRMVEWYDEDTDSKIRLLEVTHTDDEVEEFRHQLTRVVTDMDIAVSEGHSACYRNAGYCKVWGRRCEYSSVCLHYDPDLEYIEFTKEGRKLNADKAN